MTLPGGLSVFRNVVCLENLQKMFILLTIKTRHESPQQPDVHPLSRNAYQKDGGHKTGINSSEPVYG